MENQEQDTLLGDILSTYTEMMDAAHDTQELNRQASNSYQRQKNAEARLGKLLADATHDTRSSLIGYPLSNWSALSQDH